MRERKLRDGFELAVVVEPMPLERRHYALKALFDVMRPGLDQLCARDGCQLVEAEPMSNTEYERKLEEARQHIRNRTGPFLELELPESSHPDRSTPNELRINQPEKRRTAG